MALRLHELARRLGARFDAAGANDEIDALAMPGVASARDLSFLVPGMHPGGGRAAAVLVDRKVRDEGGVSHPLEVDDVLLALSRATAWLGVRRCERAYGPGGAAGIHPSARVSPRADVSETTVIGERTEIGAGAVIGDGVTLGAFCVVGPGACISGPASIGNRCHVGAGCVIGADGFAFVQNQGRWHELPHFGGVRLDDDVVMRSQSTVHAGVFGDTVIGAGCLLDSQVLIGHDARLGAGSAIAGQTAVAGAASIGRNCRIGGKAAIGEGVVIADRVTVTGMSMVIRSIHEPGTRYSSGWPAEPSRTWWRRVVNLRRFGGSLRQPGVPGAGD